MTPEEKAYAHIAKSVYKDIIGYTRAVLRERDELLKEVDSLHANMIQYNTNIVAEMNRMVDERDLAIQLGKALEEQRDQLRKELAELRLQVISDIGQEIDTGWKNAALRVGEDLCSVGPFGYYTMTAQQWLDWALSVVTVHPAPVQPKAEPVQPVAQVVAVYPPGQDGYEVNWLKGNKTKPGDLLYAYPELERSDADFKNFHKQLCDRFGYQHDSVYWKRDQVSLIEWIAKKAKPVQEPVAWANQYGLVSIASGGGYDTPLYAAPQDGLRKAAQAVVDHWDTPLWKDVPTTAEYINALREALNGS